MEVIAEKPTLATGWWDVATGERNDRLDVLNVFVSTFRSLSRFRSIATDLLPFVVDTIFEQYLSFLDPAKRKKRNLEKPCL